MRHKSTAVEKWEEGKLRLRKRFCWFNTVCEDGYTYWLESIWVLEETVVVKKCIPETHTFYNAMIWCSIRQFGKDIPSKYKHIEDENARLTIMKEDLNRA